MDLFKNEVGRPSNETLKKRRNFKIFISVFAVVAVLLVGFGVYKVLVPEKINGEGLNADAIDRNKFYFVDKGNNNYSVEKPANAVNWKIEIKYKETGKVTWKTYHKENHYGDGAKTHEFSLKQYNTKATYRISVKWTKGKNDLTYSSPKKWAPKGWKYNLLTGWAYKDIEVSAISQNSQTTQNNLSQNIIEAIDVKVASNSDAKTTMIVGNTYYNVKHYISYTNKDSSIIWLKADDKLSVRIDVPVAMYKSFNSNTNRYRYVITSYNYNNKVEQTVDGYVVNSAVFGTLNMSKTIKYVKAEIYSPESSGAKTLLKSVKINVSALPTIQYTYNSKVTGQELIVNTSIVSISSKITNDAKNTLYYKKLTYKSNEINANNIEKEGACTKISASSTSLNTFSFTSKNSTKAIKYRVYLDKAFCEADKKASNKNRQLNETQAYYLAEADLRITRK